MSKNNNASAIAPTETTTVALDKLVRHPHNVRQTTATGIAELAASIERDGLLQNLTAVKLTGGEGDGYGIVAGGRRLAALQLLAKDKKIPKDWPVPVRLVDSSDAEAVSLAENQMREQMHPIDQFVAFKAQVDAGNPIAEVAARFGVTEAFVKQRLKLAAVSPQLLDAYRAGAMTLEHLQEFTVTDNHERQLEVWEDVKVNIKNDWFDAGDIKNELLGDAVGSNDVRLKFVGVKNYQKAGGAIIAADLFAGKDDNSETVSDPELLDRLALEKLQKHAAKLQKDEGLAWCDSMVTFSMYRSSDYGRVPTVEIPMTDEQAKLHAELEEKIEALGKQIDANHDADEFDDDLDTRLCDEQSELEEQRDAIDEACTVPHPDALEYAGAVVSIDHKGKIEITRNLIKQADLKNLKPVAKTSATSSNSSNSDDDDASEPVVQASHSEKLMRRMTAHKTAILRLSILERGADSLAVVVHHMLTEELQRETHRGAMQSTALHVSSELVRLQPWADDIGSSEAVQQFEQRSIELLAPVRAHMEANQSEGLYQFLAAQPANYLLQLLAYCTAKRTNLVIGKEGQEGKSQLLEGDYLNDQMITDFWQPTRANYLDHVSKGQMIAAVTEAVGEAAAAQLSTMKKDAAAERAEEMLKDTGWLPSPMRVKP